MRLELRSPIATLTAVIFLAACGHGNETSTASPGTSTATVSTAADWDAFVSELIEARFEAHPVSAVKAGKHEFDGQLPDWSRESIQREIDRIRAERETALAFVPADLGAQRSFQREYLLATLDRDLFWLDKAAWPFRNPAFYFDGRFDSLDPSPYVTLTYAPIEQRLTAVTRYLTNIPRAAQQIRANLATPLPATWVEYGIRSFAGLAEYYGRDLVEAFTTVGDPALRQAFDEARQPAIAAMAALSAWLESERERATTDFALGSELFRQMLHDTERVDTDLAMLEQIGRADLERNTRALEAACRQYLPGAEISRCVARMDADKPADGPVAAARKQLAGLKAHVVSEDLLTIPSDDEAGVEQAPPFARANFAYIRIPGPYETGQRAIYYIAPPDPSWPQEMQRAYIPGQADLLFTSVHEVWPGHFLNYLHARRSDWIFSRLFVGYAFAEGWAHYTEEMMWDTGLGHGAPEVHIGQLSNALLRDIRFLSAIGLHTAGMSVGQSERMFIEQAFQSEGTARQQAARGTYDPAYLNYTLGKLLILGLREDWTRDRGGRSAWKLFHDEFLSYGGPPIPLVRAQMLGGPVEAVF